MIFSSTYRRIFSPYVIKVCDDDPRAFLILNRDYKPLGIFDKQPHRDTRLAITGLTPRKAKKLGMNVQYDDAGRPTAFYLYEDSNRPDGKRPADLKRYEKIVAALMKMRIEIAPAPGAMSRSSATRIAGALKSTEAAIADGWRTPTR